jgi:hypothetical protein
MRTSLRRWSFALCLSFGVVTQSIAALGHDDLKNVEAISVEKDAMPKTMSYLGPDQGIGLIFGGIGGAIEGAANQNKKPEQVIIDFAAENHIVIADICARRLSPRSIKADWPR